MLIVSKITGRTVESAGITYRFFSGTSYLAMNTNREFCKHLKEGMKTYGMNYSSSRNSNVRLKVYEEAEQQLAAYTGAAGAITVSSGYMAAQLTVRALAGTGEMIYAPNTHPALWMEPANFYYADFEDWVSKLPGKLERSSATEFVILTNSLDPLLAKNYSFDWVASLPNNKNITLVIDDSHGFGITGTNGSGIYSQVKKSANHRLIVVSSFGKAMGIPGGIILSDKTTLEQLKKSAYFNTSSPVSPAYLYAFLKSGSIYEHQRQQLFANIQYFDALTRHTGLFRYFENYPVFYTSDNKVSSFLLDRKLLISSFAYPLPEDDLITRVVLNSSHRKKDIEFLAACVRLYASKQRE